METKSSSQPLETKQKLKGVDFARTKAFKKEKVTLIVMIPAYNEEGLNKPEDTLTKRCAFYSFS